MLDFLKNGAFVAVIAHGLIGASLVWDKVLLKHPGTKNLFSYVFWLGSLSIFGLALIPFGYHTTPMAVIVLAFFTGVLHLIGVFFYYAALKSGEASETLAIMGGFSPVATALIALALLTQQMTGTQLIGFALMSAGGFVMFLSEKPPLRKLLPPVLLAAGLLGLVNVLEKVVYNQTNFISGYVWFTAGTFTGSLLLLVPSSWRRQIFTESKQSEPRNRFWYFVNRVVSGVGSLLIYYAVSLTHPAIVDAISGVRYGVIFLGALLLTKFRPDWLKEDFGGWQLVSKVTGVILVGVGLTMLGINSGKTKPSGSPTATAQRPVQSQAAWLEPSTARVLSGPEVTNHNDVSRFGPARDSQITTRRPGKIKDSPGFEIGDLPGLSSVQRQGPDVRNSIHRRKVSDRLAVVRPAEG